MKLTAIKLEEDVKTIPDIWKRDKALLHKSNPSICKDDSSDVPKQKDVAEVMTACGERYDHPSQPLTLDRRTLDSILSWMVPAIELVWGERFNPLPDIEIANTGTYKRKAVRLEKEQNKAVGWGALSDGVNGVYTFNYQYKILLPEQSIIRVVGGKTLGMIIRPHEKPRIEELICGALSAQLFRQVRGETGQCYVDAINSIGAGNTTSSIQMMNRAIIQRVKEIITNETNPDWALYVLSDKFNGIFNEHNGMDIYRCVDALTSAFSLGQIAMIDTVCVRFGFKESGKVVEYFLSPLHPNHAKKLAKFRNE